MAENLEEMESWLLVRKTPGNWLGWYSVAAFVTGVESNAT